MSVTSRSSVWLGSAGFAFARGICFQCGGKALLLLRLQRAETDLGTRPCRRLHQLPNRVKQRRDVLILRYDSGLQIRQLSRHFFMCSQHSAEANEGSNHLNAGVYGNRAVEDAGQHDRAVLGEGIRPIAPSAAPRF